MHVADARARGLLDGELRAELAARLDLPVDDEPIAFALFAHCFTCSKDYKGVARVSRALAAEGVAVLRFDFTGLGESEGEIRETLEDLRRSRVDIVTFGQYLRPTAHHLPVQRFVTPDEFARYRQWGLELGFLEVVSGPLVRSSYRADRVFEQNNVGLDPVAAS